MKKASKNGEWLDEWERLEEGADEIQDTDGE